MESRAIARPDGPARGPERRRIAASMEGRAIARPDVRFLARQAGEDILASMEGRAIARPDKRCPAARTCSTTALQWRAEQLLGQTPQCNRRWCVITFRFNGGPSNCSARPPVAVIGLAWRTPASMEGRAIARPDLEEAATGLTGIMSLQWRAEQLLGQTIARWEQTTGGTAASMEGRAIARPDVLCVHPEAIPFA